MHLEESLDIRDITSLQRINYRFVLLDALHVVDLEVRAQMSDAIMMGLCRFDYFPDVEISGDLDDRSMKPASSERDEVFVVSQFGMELLIDELLEA